jgi:hypothetical protein
MPKALHDKLERSARKAGLKGERKDAYVYGTMDKIEKQRHEKEKRYFQTTDDHQ